MRCTHPRPRAGLCTCQCLPPAHTHDDTVPHTLEVLAARAPAYQPARIPTRRRVPRRLHDDTRGSCNEKRLPTRCFKRSAPRAGRAWRAGSALGWHGCARRRCNARPAACLPRTARGRATGVCPHAWAGQWACTAAAVAVVVGNSCSCGGDGLARDEGVEHLLHGARLVARRHVACKGVRVGASAVQGEQGGVVGVVV